ncbi:MAG: cob(I)yrinic acid a,c-diamide adenosyltransferase [Burkholderiales bacterium]
MANRLTKITTRTGDDGSTGLADGSRVGKDSLRIAALGDVDELNSHLGVLLAEKLPPNISSVLAGSQHELFDLGGEIAIPGHFTLTEKHLARLDELIAQFNPALPPLKEFILPGGSRAAALCHVARTVARRAERSVVALAHKESVSPLAIQYLNRLSDLLFILCRVINREQGVGDVYWKPQNSQSL